MIFSVLVEMPFLFGSYSFAYSSQGTKEINMEGRGAKSTLNNLFSCSLAIYAVTSSSSVFVWPPQRVLPRKWNVLWSKTQPQSGWFHWEVLLMVLCCPPGQLHVNVSQELDKHYQGSVGPEHLSLVSWVLSSLFTTTYLGQGKEFIFLLRIFFHWTK